MGMRQICSSSEPTHEASIRTKRTYANTYDVLVTKNEYHIHDEHLRSVRRRRRKHTPSDTPTPSSRPSATPTAPTPKLAPPPTPTPPPTTTPTPSLSTPLAIEAIDDSFFDGLDATPPAAAGPTPSSSTAAGATPQRGTPAAQSQAEEDDDEDEMVDMLPLLDDPDDE